MDSQVPPPTVTLFKGKDDFVTVPVKGEARTKAETDGYKLDPKWEKDAHRRNVEGALRAALGFLPGRKVIEGAGKLSIFELGRLSLISQVVLAKALGVELKDLVPPPEPGPPARPTSSRKADRVSHIAED